MQPYFFINLYPAFNNLFSWKICEIHQNMLGIISHIYNQNPPGKKKQKTNKVAKKKFPIALYMYVTVQYTYQQM